LGLGLGLGLGRGPGLEPTSTAAAHARAWETDEAWPRSTRRRLTEPPSRSRSR